MTASPGTRTLAALVALTLLLTGAAPLVGYLCETNGGAAEVASVERTCCPEGASDCLTRPAGDTPVMTACCTDAPALATEQVAVTPPATPQLWAAVAPLAAWLVPPAVPVEAPRPLDSGPPGLSLRPHLAFSVLLI